MDQLLSNIIPTNRTGDDGFNWWVGQVEGIALAEGNNKGGFRYKVRIVGEHPESSELLDTSELPWCQVMMPVNVPYLPGNIAGAHPQLQAGCWVIGFYMDPERQKPIIMGSIGQTPGATTVIKYLNPEDTKNFQTTLDTDKIDPNTDAEIPPENREGGESDNKNTATGGIGDGSKDGDDKLRVSRGLNDDNPGAVIEPLKVCVKKAEKCDDTDLKTQMTYIMGDFLRDVQRSNGNVGTYLVDKYTGRLYSGIGVARKYTNKAMKVIRKFIAKIKGYIISKLKDAVKAITNAIMRPTDTGNALTPVTEFFNKILKQLGCSMEDLGERLMKWLTNVLMSYLAQIYRSVACQIDSLVNGILSKINQLLNGLFSAILGPLQSILGAIAAPLNIIGGVINYVLNLLGITCVGPDRKCSKKKKVCNQGEEDDGENDQDFLDKLLSDLDGLFGDTPADYTQYVCDEAYTGKPLEVTNIGFTGGVPLPTLNKIVYSINDITVEEGEAAKFTITRTGATNIASSVDYKILENQGSATKNIDYVPEEGILGFAANEINKTIEIQTLYSAESELDETFFIKLTHNTPQDNDDVDLHFIKNIGKCTITERDQKEEGDPYVVGPIDPWEPIKELDPGGDPTPVPENDLIERWSVSANRATCPEGEFIIYEIVTSNVEDGTFGYYTLSGRNITAGDIIGRQLSGGFVIEDKKAYVTIGIEEDNEIEDVETLRFTINGKGASTDVLITVDDDTDLSDYDLGEGETVENTVKDFELPVVNSGDIITDGNGGIIEIPVAKSGSPWAEPPYVWIGGEGFGAIGTPLLDSNGFIKEIRVKSPGFGYKINRASDNDRRCIIDSFTVILPGRGYLEPPTIWINGQKDVAEAIINDDGFLIGARVLRRELTYEEMPEIKIVGGSGHGAKMIPSLLCLGTDALSEVGSTKVGTGRYVDCP